MSFIEVWSEDGENGEVKTIHELPQLLVGRTGEKGEKGDKGEKGEKGESGTAGPKGATFTPFVDFEGNLSWSNDGGLENPESVNIMGPQGLTGASGSGTVSKDAYITTAADLAAVLSGTKNNVLVELSPGATFTFSSALVVQNCNNIFIRGNGATFNGCLKFNGSSYAKNVWIDNVKFATSQNADNIDFFTRADNIFITNCYFTNTNASYGSSNNGLLYFNAGTGGSNIVIDNCTFTTTSSTLQKAGIKIKGHNESANNKEYTNVIIHKCKFIDLHGMGIELHTNVNDVLISNCTFKNIRKGANGAIGISVVGDTGVHISDCKFYNCSWGIEPVGTDIVIANCDMYNITSYWIQMSGPFDGVLITGCNFRNASGTPVAIGMTGGDGERKNLRIKDCCLYEVWIETKSSSLSSFLTNFVVADCEIYNTKSAGSGFVFVTACKFKDMVLRNNMIRNITDTNLVRTSSTQDMNELIKTNNIFL